MANKLVNSGQITLNDKALVDRYINPLLDPIKNATGNGKWEGIDGAAQYLNGANFIGLKKRVKEEAAYNLALEKCLLAITEVSVLKRETNVLEKFTREHLDFILSLSRKKPGVFKENDGILERICKSIMNEKQQKEFEKNLHKIKKLIDSMV